MMPRPSYAEHRALKRRGSFESETDAGSLASFTTHQSSSSFQPSYAYASSSRLTVPKPRTFSSTSASSSTSPLLQAQGQVPRPQYPSRLGVNSQVDEASLKRREARRKRRDEREKKSTLRGEEYDTRLRRVVRWISKKGWRGRSIALVAVVWAMLRMDMERDRLSRHLTLHRYHFETTAAPFPYIGEKLIGLSDRSFMTMIISFNLGLELLSWCYGIIQWTRRQGADGGRSWRSQVIATISILLAPGLFLSSNDSNFSPQIPIGLAACDILFLTYGTDRWATTTFLLAAILDKKWGLFLPVLFVMILARCTSRGLWHDGWSVWIIALSPIWTSLVEGTIKGTLWQKVRGYHGDSFLVKWLYGSMLGNDGICRPYAPNIWCATNPLFRWNAWPSVSTINRLSTVLAILTIAPILGVVFYAAYSSKPTGGHQPGANLLPLALFTSSLAFALFLPASSPDMLVVPLLPLSLMSCMRGGKDDLGDGAEWEWTVLLHTVVTTYLAATDRAGSRSLGVPTLAIWNYLLSSQGSKRGGSQLRRHRETIEVVCMGLYAATFLITPSAIPFWEEGWCLFVFVVCVTAWGWGMSRLYLTAWASGVLGRRGL